jgi:hypothetical protein
MRGIFTAESDKSSVLRMLFQEIEPLPSLPPPGNRPSFSSV